MPDPDAPVTHPDDLTAEHVDAMAGAEVSAGAAGTVDVVTDLGEQIPDAAGQVVPADQVVRRGSATPAGPTPTVRLMALPAAQGAGRRSRPARGRHRGAGHAPRFRVTVTGVDGTTTSTHETVVRPTAEVLGLAEVGVPHPR